MVAFQAHIKADELPQAKDCPMQVGALLKTPPGQIGGVKGESDGFSLVKLRKARLEWTASGHTP